MLHENTSTFMLGGFVHFEADAVVFWDLLRKRPKRDAHLLGRFPTYFGKTIPTIAKSFETITPSMFKKGKIYLFSVSQNTSVQGCEDDTNPPSLCVEVSI